VRAAMPGSLLRLLLAGCLAAISLGCNEKTAASFNSSLVSAVTGAVGAWSRSVKTVGDCAAVVDPALRPCQAVPIFPLQMQGDNWEINAPYATGLDTLDVTDLSLRCDSASAIWIAEFNFTVHNLSIQLTAQVDLATWLWSKAPKFTQTKLLQVAGFSARAVARVECVDGSSLRMLLDPAEDSLTLSKIELGISALSLDVSPHFVQLLRRPLLQGTTLTPPAPWGPRMLGVICSTTTKELEGSLVI